MPSVPVLFDDEPQNFNEEDAPETPDTNYPEVMLEPLHAMDRLCLKWHLNGLTTPPTPDKEPPAPLPMPAAPLPPASRPPSAPPQMYPPMGAAGLPPSSRPQSGYLRLLGLLSTGRPWECSLPLADMARTGGITLGRDPSCCEVVLQEPGISRRHAVFERFNGSVTVTDQNSTNGTFLNGRRLTAYDGRVPLQDGSILSLGDVSLRVEIFTPNGAYI